MEHQDDVEHHDNVQQQDGNIEILEETESFDDDEWCGQSKPPATKEVLPVPLLPPTQSADLPFPKNSPSQASPPAANDLGSGQDKYLDSESDSESELEFPAKLVTVGSFPHPTWQDNAAASGAQPRYNRAPFQLSSNSSLPRVSQDSAEQRTSDSTQVNTIGISSRPSTSADTPSHVHPAARTLSSIVDHQEIVDGSRRDPWMRSQSLSSVNAQMTT